MPPSHQGHILSPEHTSVCLCVRASRVFAYLKLYRPVRYHTAALNCLRCFSARVRACLFAQLVSCSPYRQHQPKPTAVLPDSEPMCNEGPTLRCANKLRLLMNTALLPPLSVCQSKHTHALRFCSRDRDVCLVVGVLSKKNLLVTVGIFVNANLPVIIPLMSL